MSARTALGVFFATVVLALVRESALAQIAGVIASIGVGLALSYVLAPDYQRQPSVLAPVATWIGVPALLGTLFALVLPWQLGEGVAFLLFTCIVQALAVAVVLLAVHRTRARAWAAQLSLGVFETSSRGALELLQAIAINEWALNDVRRQASLLAKNMSVMLGRCEGLLRFGLASGVPTDRPSVTASDSSPPGVDPLDVTQLVIDDCLQLVTSELEREWYHMGFSDSGGSIDDAVARFEVRLGEYVDRIRRVGLLSPGFDDVDGGSGRRSRLVERLWARPNVLDELGAIDSSSEFLQLNTASQLGLLEPSADDAIVIRFAPTVAKPSTSRQFEDRFIWTASADAAGAIRLVPLTAAGHHLLDQPVS